MRTFAALGLFVSLLTKCDAQQDWPSVHGSGLEAANRNDYETAAARFRKSLPLARTDRQKATTENDLGIMLHRAGQEAEARTWLRQALISWQATPGASNQYARTAGALASVDRLLGEYAEAEELLRTTLGDNKVTGDARSYLLSELADLLREKGGFTEARGLLKEAAGVPGVTPRQRVDSLINLADLDRDTRNWDSSVEEWNEATAQARAGGYTDAEAGCARGLGQTWLDRGNLSRAEPLLKSAFALSENKGLHDGARIAILISLGELYLAQDKAGLAEETFQRGLQLGEGELGPTHPQMAVILEMRAVALALRHEAGLARDCLDRAERIMTMRFGAESPILGSVYANRGLVEQRLNNPDAAAAQYRKALDVIGAAGPDAEPMRWRVIRQYAEMLKGMHRKREAQALLAEAKAFR
jgi:tetratricopeptide (TPR) repeat protein